MSWSVLQSNGVTYHGVAGPYTCQYASNVQSGTKLICVISAELGTPSAVQDGSGNSLTLLSSVTFAASGGGTPATTGTLTFWAMDTPAGDVGTRPVLTATFTASQFLVMTIQEVSGLLAGNTTAMLDGTPGTSSGAGTGAAVSAGAYTSSAASEYLVAIYGDDSNVTNSTITAVTGSTTYTIDAGSQQNNGSANDTLAYGNSTNGSETASFATTTNSGDNYATILVAFKLGAAAPVPSGVLVRGPARPPVAPRQVPPQVITGTVAGSAVTANAGLATAAGTALGPVPAIAAPAGLATAAGTTPGPVPGITAQAGLASASGTAFQPSASAVSAAYPAVQASFAAISVPRQIPPQVITTLTVSAVTANAGLASASGIASGPVPDITADPGIAAASGTAGAPGPAITAQAGLAAGTGAAGQPDITGQPIAALSSATGSALAPVPEITVLAGLATAAGTAFQPAISGTGTASAGLASAAGTAPGPIPQITAQAGLASAVGTASGPAAAIGALAALAGATAQALAPIAAIETAAGLAAAAAGAQNPSIPLPGNVTADAGLATAAATALQPSAVLVPAAVFSLGQLSTDWQLGLPSANWQPGVPSTDWQLGLPYSQ